MAGFTYHAAGISGFPLCSASECLMQKRVKEMFGLSKGFLLACTKDFVLLNQ